MIILIFGCTDEHPVYQTIDITGVLKGCDTNTEFSIVARHLEYEDKVFEDLTSCDNDGNYFGGWEDRAPLKYKYRIPNPPEEFSFSFFLRKK